MNLIILSGNLCKDNELKYTQNNIQTISNTIAVKNDYKNINGEYESQFINFVAYRNNAEFINKYTQKGDKILLKGRWNSYNYEDKEGKRIYINEMVVDKVEPLSTKYKAKKNNAEKDEEYLFKEFGEELDIDNFLE